VLVQRWKECIPLANDFQESVGVRGIELELGRELGKEKNLDRSTTSVPPGPNKVDQRTESLEYTSNTDPEIPYL
jgi:hypothetical protein